MANEMAVSDKTAELLMGASNPNHPDEKAVRLELIERLNRDNFELKDEISELRCASRLLNDRLVRQANCINTERQAREDLQGVVRRARMILVGAHLVRYKTHAKNFHHLTMAMPACQVCRVLLEMERGSSPVSQAVKAEGGGR